MKMTNTTGQRLGLSCGMPAGNRRLDQRGISRFGAASLMAMLAMGAPLGAQAEGLARPSGANIERGPNGLPPEGFLLTIEGLPTDGDAGGINAERRADLRLDRNDVTVTFDGLGAQPRLDALVLDPANLRPGAVAKFQSRINYPAFTSRGEIRLYSDGGRRLLQTAPIAANGTASLLLPQGGDLAYSYRVYDSAGRYDETALMPLAAEAMRRVSRGAEHDAGIDNTARRAIPIRGGAVTVQVRNMMAGSRVNALGTSAAASADGMAVINRILPVGAHDVEVQARGATIIRPVQIPASEWFATGVADLTFGMRQGNYEDLGQGRSYTYGRLQGYAKGHTANGWSITASADTQEDELSDLLRNLTKRDPRAVLTRLDPDQYYPTYGDDSQITDDTPTSSGIYLKAERDGSHAVLGDFRSSINHTELLRNERQLYGLQGLYQTPAQTSRGEARASVEVYGAQPEELPRRDQFRGTGSSAYFLSQRDVSIGSETVQLEIRDPDTGRVIERKTLTLGRDYEINYAQGLVMLRRPLSSFARDAGFITGAETDGFYLVVQYDFVPLFEDLDGYSYGGRAEAWLADGLRIGATGAVDTTGEADQTATGVDLRLALGDNSYIQLEHAQSEGPGFSSTFSSDGGMNLTESPRLAGKGSASRIDAQIDTREAGLGFDGLLSLDYEEREAGFATVDRQADRDEILAALTLSAKLSERTGLRLGYEYYDAFESDRKTEITAELDHQLSAATSIALGYYHLDRSDVARADRSGKRDDLGLKLSHQMNDALRIYGYGIASVAHQGEMARGDRLGLGAEWQINQAWRLTGELSDGDAGQGALAHLSYGSEKGSAYVGYELAADRDSDTAERLSGEDGGQFVWGGRRIVSDSVNLLSENSYDMFGDKRSLSSSYGVEYLQHSQLTHDLRYEYGSVHDRGANDIERQAFSFGSRYDNQAGLAMRGRIELRRDREDGVTSDSSVEDSVLLTSNIRYDATDSRRLMASVDLLRSDGSSENSRDYTDIVLGYALRPVEHDRWTVLAKYQYFYDLFGQTLGSSENRGPRQRSHVFSLDGTYRVSADWSLGAKAGGRMSETQSEDGPWAQNDAFLGVLNARYHLPHEWDLLIEGRYLTTRQAGLDQAGLLLAGYKHFGDNFMLGAGYNFSSFSDDLTDLVQDDRGLFLNLIAKY